MCTAGIVMEMLLCVCVCCVCVYVCVYVHMQEHAVVFVGEASPVLIRGGPKQGAQG